MVAWKFLQPHQSACRSVFLTDNGFGPDRFMMLNDARRAFLAELIDYAGLFPPAELSMDESLARYAEDRTGPESWMLGRFIAPAARLEEIDPAEKRFSEGGPVRLSVLGAKPVGDESWDEAFRRSLLIAGEFVDQFAKHVVCDRFETPLPARSCSDPDRLERTLISLAEEGLSPHAVVALELPFLSSPESVEPATYAIAAANRGIAREGFVVKLRCGGVTPDAFPTVESLASAITTARDASVPFKATAGLHHPFRHEAEEIPALMFGFMNVFGGAILAAEHHLGADDLAEILDDRDPRAWRLDEVLGWNSLTASASAIDRARRDVALTFGSCSFDDPRADLRLAGWL